MAPYYDDQLWYPAVITKLHLDDGKCEVLYDVYDEIACVDIADLTKYVFSVSLLANFFLVVSQIFFLIDSLDVDRCALVPPFTVTSIK